MVFNDISEPIVNESVRPDWGLEPTLRLPMQKVVCACSALVTIGLARPAYADATLFIGATRTPTSRPVRGFAASLSLLIIGFEFEYSDTAEDTVAGAPALDSGMFNVLAQTPIPVAAMQFYATIGAGLYRERLGERQATSGGINTGGGVKISLAGPLRLRVDYRVFSLRGDPLHDTAQRLYAGLNLAF